MLIASRATDAWSFADRPVLFALALCLPALYVAMAVTRLGLYTAYDSDASETNGTPTTLAATILSAGVLAGFVGPALLVALSGLLAALMVTEITYPDLHPQDALVMGVVQACAIGLRGRPGEVFAFALLFLSLAYLTLGPRFYWT
jgi:CDP-diacylglycerol--serine O-phosphatidyltransferase